MLVFVSLPRKPSKKDRKSHIFQALADPKAAPCSQSTSEGGILQRRRRRRALPGSAVLWAMEQEGQGTEKVRSLFWWGLFIILPCWLLELGHLRIFVDFLVGFTCSLDMFLFVVFIFGGLDVCFRYTVV